MNSVAVAAVDLSSGEISALQSTNTVLLRCLLSVPILIGIAAFGRAILGPTFIVPIMYFLTLTVSATMSASQLRTLSRYRFALLLASLLAVVLLLRTLHVWTGPDSWERYLAVSTTVLLAVASGAYLLSLRCLTAVVSTSVAWRYFVLLTVLAAMAAFMSLHNLPTEHAAAGSRVIANAIVLIASAAMLSSIGRRLRSLVPVSQLCG
jgi:hypothetical protein